MNAVLVLQIASVHAKRWMVLLTSTLILSCGTTPPGPTLVELPTVDSNDAVVLNLTTKANPSPIKHYHVLSLDGQKFVKLEESEKKQFLIPPGEHMLDLTCHTRNTRSSMTFPVNYNVSDGDASMEINAEAGEELCIKVSFRIGKCAVLEDADPSEC